MKKKSVRRWKESQLRNPVVKGASSVSISELADHEVHSDVIVAGRTPRDNVFFPSVVRLHTGELIVVYRAALGHGNIPPGRILCTRSKDGGNTWSQPEVVIDTPYDDRDPRITQLSDGSLMLTYNSTDTSKGTPRNYVYVCRSFDCGYTWMGPVRVSDVPCGTFEEVLEMPNGRLLLPVYRPRDPSRRGSGVRKEDYLRYLADVEAGREKRSPEEVFPLEGYNPHVSVLMVSEDRGRTWHQGCAIAQGPIGFNETGLAYLGDDHIVAVVRTDAPFANACIVHSEDGGKSFGKPRMLNTNAHAPDMLVIDEDRVLLSYGACDYTGGYVTRYVMAMLGDAKRDFEGATEKIIYTGSGGDASYPSAVRMGPDEAFVVYYDAGVGIIGGRFLKLSDLA